MTPGDSEITGERLQEITELTLELEEEIPEVICIAVQEPAVAFARLPQRTDASNWRQQLLNTNPARAYP